MVDVLRIGMSALLAQQRALAVTSNNIANANTPGYTRQRAELSTQPTERLGNSFVGRGVGVAGIRRLTDELLISQLRMAISSFHRSEAFAGLADGIEFLLADSQTGLDASLQNFVNATQDLADNPSSSAVRQTVLSGARQLAAMFVSYGARLNQIENQAAARVQATVAEINSLGRGLAELNTQLLALSTNGQAPPDLEDQRDVLMSRLAELVNVSSLVQQDGTTSVFIGAGQALVLGGNATELAVVAGDFNVAGSEIALRTAHGETVVTSFLSGGELGGLLDFKRELLAPVRNELGRIAHGLVGRLNAIHREGVDMQGQLGRDFFSVQAPKVYASQANSGTGTLSVAVENVGGLEPTSYRLEFDGSTYQLLRNDGGGAVALTGSGTIADPLRGAGLAIVVGGSPAAGDRYLIEPLAEAAGSVRLLITDPSEIAAAAPVRTRADLANIGNASISAGMVDDIEDPNLLASTTIEFLSATTYSIDGAGTYAYSNGGDIVVNGVRIQISGAPATGDRFIIEPNTGGVGDNRNALRFEGAIRSGLLENGTLSLSETASRLVARVGTQAQEAIHRRDAQHALLENAEGALESVRGVNLDEEAARLLEQEQLYQAAAQTIAVADSLFQILMAALRR